jgi:PAS domain S-box-containing protein
MRNEETTMKHWQFGGIKGKLLVGLGAVLAFTALIAITGVWWIMKLERANDEIVDAGLTVERQIKEWHRLTRANTLRTLLLLKTNDPVLEKEVRVEIDETVKNVNVILRKLETALRDDPIAETFSTAVERRLQYQKIRTDAFREKMAGNEGEVSRVIGQELLPAQNSFQAAVQRLSDQQVAQMQELVAGNNAQSERARFIVAASTSITFVLALLFWLTARKRSREVERTLNHQLLESTELQQAILDSANFSIISTDINGMIRLFNNGAHRMLGYSAGEVFARHTPSMLHDETEMAERAQQLSIELGQPVKAGFETLVARARGGLADEREWTYIRKDGSRLPVMVSVTALRDAQLALTGFLCVAYDLIERKKVENMKNEFISTVSHELRTPLTSIRGSLGLIFGGVGGELPEAVKNLVGIAKSNCERLIRLINDMLDSEKIESGKMRLDLQVIDIRPLVQQVLAANEGFAGQYSVTLRLQAPDAQLQVRIDGDRMIQVLTNLLSNAVKFTPPGGAVEVRVSRVAQSVRVEVVDPGPGIPEEFRGRIFQKFSQADSSDTRQKGGTGLGLNISKALIEKMGGSIGFTSAVGIGTTFFFELPEWQNPVPLLQPFRAKADSFQPRILICEDDPDVARLISMMLAKAGFEAEMAYSAEQALACLARSSYDAVTVDLKLPGQNGIAFISALRDNESTRTLPVVVISALAEEGQLQFNHKPLTVSDWLQKPIDEDLLILSVRRAVAGMPAGKPRILHVEDDLDIQRIVAEVPQDFANFRFAATLDEARALLQEQRFDLVLLDLGLGKESSWDLVEDIDALDPRPPVILFSPSDADLTEGKQAETVLLKARTSNIELLSTIQRILQIPADPRPAVPIP